MQAIAPNLTVLVGELVGARLIAHAGSLINLAKHPASTVQILGAEKALFRSASMSAQNSAMMHEQYLQGWASTWSCIPPPPLSQPGPCNTPTPAVHALSRQRPHLVLPAHTVQESAHLATQYRNHQQFRSSTVQTPGPLSPAPPPPALLCVLSLHSRVLALHVMA